MYCSQPSQVRLVALYGVHWEKHNWNCTQDSDTYRIYPRAPSDDVSITARGPVFGLSLLFLHSFSMRELKTLARLVDVIVSTKLIYIK